MPFGGELNITRFEIAVDHRRLAAMQVDQSIAQFPADAHHFFL